ncbi:MAG: LytTR family transcriptional regulator DNA-binding domain-containing protein [Bacteroidales bacterium]|nr:LytTR family transcriptional regulator DNA-binding domain-containing protein [Bacteroidales bacterium]MDD4209896.1 LytTR family transcriptional regulator DNA-binding domain-containing protein [Bacteroidales bacterium]
MQKILGLHFMGKIVPSYIVEKGNIIKLLLFVTFFVLIFIVIFKPFNSNNWIEGMSIDKFVIYSIIMVTMGLGVLAVSRIIMYQSRHSITLYYWTYTLWLLGEILAISIVCTLFAWFIHPRNADYFQILPYTLQYTTLVLFLPYIISWLFFELKYKNMALEHVKKNGGKSIMKPKVEESGLINFTDDKGNLKLSVNLDNLFYIEAADNYVKICYINKEKVSHFILRNSLKNIEDSFSDINLIRCHRSFIINFLKVKVMRREKDGLYIEMDSKSLPDIPISKTYAKKVMELFSNSSI